jgi:hypothetical protein
MPMMFSRSPSYTGKRECAAVDDDIEDVVVGRIDVDQVHPRRGDHHVAGGLVRHPDHALEHHARFGADDVVVFRVGQGLDQLGLRVRSGMDELGNLLQECALVFLFGSARRVRVGHRPMVQDVR